MKLVVPYVGALQPADARLIRLADFLGVQAEAVALSKSGKEGYEFLNASVSGEPACIVVNPSVIQVWVPNDYHLPELLDALMARIAHILVHGVRPEPYHA